MKSVTRRKLLMAGAAGGPVLACPARVRDEAPTDAPANVYLFVGNALARPAVPATASVKAYQLGDRRARSRLAGYRAAGGDRFIVRKAKA